MKNNLNHAGLEELAQEQLVNVSGGYAPEQSVNVSAAGYLIGFSFGTLGNGLNSLIRTIEMAPNIVPQDGVVKGFTPSW